jgi:hypothetical protein
MSAAIQEHAIDLLWRQWTAVGVAGVAKPPEQAIDLEALIAFTPFVTSADPRLGEESLDWCLRIGKRFISISRLRQVARFMPPGAHDDRVELPALLLEKRDSDERRLSGKSRLPSLELPSLLQLRSRYIFGVGARADVLSRLVMPGRNAGAQRAAAIRPTGYTKQAVATVLDELAHAGVLTKLVHSTIVSYELAKDAALRSLLAPLPMRMPRWAERFVLVANILETWRRLGTRATYALEVAKVLDGIRPIAAAAGEQPPTVGRPSELLERIDRWAIALLDDTVWEDSWMFDDEDIASEILDALRDEIIQTVHSDEYSVGYVAPHELCFRNIDRKNGSSDFTVQFTAEHPSEDFPFPGHVEGIFRFDPRAGDKADFLESLELSVARVHFDMAESEDD